ncbi:MAG: Na+/H+ antiporter NhaC family protein [Duncaniella sp.]|nr:Na+/H+ antiporter NhaC family protein [Duncaniella sp.]HBI58261.1 sodium:proton antiporter [Porphyromonadaceae bacterium]
MDFSKNIPTRLGLLALSPIAVFLLMYVAVSVIIGDFYKMPIAAAIVVASVWAITIYRGHTLSERIETFSRAAGHSNIMYMIWIFILAGAFASVAKEIGAVDATVNLTLRFFPSSLIIPGIFIAACFISISVGTSVGTVVALTPLAVEMAGAGGGNVPFYVAVVLGGAFFGDNLSFISDTTIAATRSQGCKMADKFKANLKLALPAAAVTLILYFFMGQGTPVIPVSDDTDYRLVIPYIIVIATAVAGINVTIVLSLGFASAMILGLINGYGIIELFGFMGAGIDSMGNLIIITLLSAGMLGVIRAAGGINYLLQVLTRSVSGTRGAQGCIALLVSLVNLCTANNTVAIITTGPIAREIGTRYGVDPRKNASLLDTCSCIVQCLIPYGAQTLLATSLAGISPAAPFPYLYYPWALAIAVLVSVLVKKK